MADLGFTFRRQKNGDVLITHNGRRASVLRHDAAQYFLEDMAELDFADQQQEMARITGNYKRGNEREAKSHPRNRM